MRHIKSAAAVLLLALLGCVNVFAQRPVHVHWTNTVESVNDTEGIIRWSADIDEGWHIYGMTMPDLGPDAIGPQLTVFTIEPASGLQLIGEVEPSIPATDKFDETLKLKLPMWEGKVEFSQRFKLTDGAKGAYIRGTVEYMACTDKSCTPPTRGVSI